MSTISLDSLKTLSSLDVQGKQYQIFNLKTAESHLGDLSKLPITLKILLENLLRHEDGTAVNLEDIHALADWLKHKKSNKEIAFSPARVLMQDFTGVPAIVDLASMRTAMANMQKNPDKINPLTRVDLVIDHSVQVDAFASSEAFKVNVIKEMERNRERYEFLRWGQEAFDNFHVVPPGTGICHQVNLEYIARCVWTKDYHNGLLAYPDTLVGTDSHTTMINGLGVLGWGVGGIEAEAAILGQPISMLIPEVVGFKLVGQLKEGITATDLVLTVTQMLRKLGVVGKFVEFYGSGIGQLSLADRATIGNMAPEYGATCGFFPIDQETLNYLRLTGRDDHLIALVEAYTKAQGMWHSETSIEPEFSSTISLDLSTVEASVAGPKRPQDRVSLNNLANIFNQTLDDAGKEDEKNMAFSAPNGDFHLHHGDVVIAAITSCTNTSNPSILMAAGLLAKKAVAKGLKTKPWVKTSLAPGSKVVTEYLAKADLQRYLNELGFYLVGYGCTTCIGNSGPLPEPVATTIEQNDLIVSAVLSGNRNFEGRVHPQVKANWLASPPLVVAYALVGHTRLDLTKDSLGEDCNGQPIYLRDIWPSTAEIRAEVAKVDSQMFRHEYADVFSGDKEWRDMAIAAGKTYKWDQKSTYIQYPPFFENLTPLPHKLDNINQMRILALFGDSITTDHISPAGSIKPDSPAGQYLQANGVAIKDFNSYGSRRGNHEVMMRGTFANIRIKNEMVPGVEGGFTKFIPENEVLSIYDAAMKYEALGMSLIIIAGKEYGTGSSRDWAAKGTNLLGVKVVLAESFERIHRSNLIGMGVLPVQFKKGMTRKSLKLDGSEIIDLLGLEESLTPNMELQVVIQRTNGKKEQIPVLCRIDTQNEAEYYRNGGILHYVLRQLMH